MKISSTEFLLISECVNKIVQGMWGNASRPEPVRAIKQIERDVSVGFGPRKEYAAALLRAEALQGPLPIYVRARPTGVADERPNVESQRVPPELLKLVLPVRGGLPDHPTHRRHGVASDGSNEDSLVVLLRHGELVIRQSDFLRWYKNQRAKGNWSSQTNRVASRRGRPTKDTGSLRNAILALVHDGVWQATDGIPKLRRLLIDRGHQPPSSDTLGRAVEKLHRLKGEPSLRRTVRKPPAPRKR